MTASYPGVLRAWNAKRDFQDPIWATHFNGAQEELSAIERVVGLWPQRATNNPARRTPDYGTVANRIQQLARVEPFISYRAAKVGGVAIPGEYYRPALTVSEDTHQMATGTGFRIPQTGYWVITAKADWQPSAASTSLGCTRTLAMEVNGEDIGLRDVCVETAKKRAMTLLEPDGTPSQTRGTTNILTWQESLLEGTHISITLTAAIADPAKIPHQVNAYLRAYLVRCEDNGNTGLPSPIFTPDPPPPPVYDDGCQKYPPSSSSGGRGPDLQVNTYDTNGNLTSTNHNPYNPPPSKIEPWWNS